MPRHLDTAIHDETNCAVEALLSSLSQDSEMGVAPWPTTTSGSDILTEEPDYYKMMMTDLGFGPVVDAQRHHKRKRQTPKVAKSLENILSADALQNNLTNTLDLASFNFMPAEEDHDYAVENHRSKKSMKSRVRTSKKRYLQATGRDGIGHGSSKVRISSSLGLRPIEVVFPKKMRDRPRHDRNRNNSNNNNANNMMNLSGPKQVESSARSKSGGGGGSGASGVSAALPLDHSYSIPVEDSEMKEISALILEKWRDYLDLSPEEMFQFEAWNAEDFSFNEDASLMVRNKGNSAWQYLDDMNPENLDIFSSHQHIYPGMPE